MSATNHAEGWVLVPVTPTQPMLDALHDAIGHDVQSASRWDGHEEVSVLDADTLPSAYAAMLSAVPVETSGWQPKDGAALSDMQIADCVTAVRPYSVALATVPAEDLIAFVRNIESALAHHSHKSRSPA